jgi:mono/diheme cytochrome c family protein
MSRPLKPILCSLAAGAVALFAGGCGHQKIGVPSASGNSMTAQIHHGAVLFSQRCSGCHTFAYAGTHGSATNVRTAQYNNGPNFDIRCERPIARVLYAIENGGFSGAIMPQNIVVGQDALDVAQFVATYAGRKAPKIPGTTQCQNQGVGTIPTSAQIAALPKK